MSIKDWPVNERPREKLLANGAHSLSDAELLAVLLGASGRRGQHAVAMARELFRGTVDGASVHPREGVKQALSRNAVAVILAHNHPLCCVASVTTGTSVTRFETRAGRGTGPHR